ncbi:hypothetical protein, partial [Vibrio vulnificus]|uniref:hypothetical protein n=1 Tax=Vibrio vulnificus TaxID=672 RepID=UPI0027DDF268
IFKNYESFQFFRFCLLLANPSRVNLVLVKMWALKLKHNKALKWDLARVAFSVCVEFGGYGTVR